MTTATTTAPTSGRANRGALPADVRVGFRSTLTSEWTKLTSLRSTWITLALGLALAVGMTVLLGFSRGSLWESESQMFQNFNPISWSLDGMFFSTIVFTVLGVTAAASEYSSGMIRLTLAVTPRRGAVLLAKVAVVAAVTGTVGLVAVVAMFLVAQAISASYGMPTADLADPDAIRAVLAAGALTAVFPVLGVALGVLLRSTAGAITFLLALWVVPDLFGALLPASWQENVISLLPSQAGQAVMMGHLMPDEATYKAPAVAALIVVGWLVLAIGAAYVALRKRDC